MTLEDPCYKVLPAALKKYKINDDWKVYALFICFGNTGEFSGRRSFVQGAGGKGTRKWTRGRKGEIGDSVGSVGSVEQ